MPKNTYEYQQLTLSAHRYNAENDLVKYPSTGEFAPSVTHTDMVIIHMVDEMCKEIASNTQRIYELEQRVIDLEGKVE